MISRTLLLASSILALTDAVLRADVVWTSTEGNVIETARRDGTAARTLVNLVSATGNSNPEPRGITNDGSFLYWTDLGQNGGGVGAGIYRANYNGTGVVRLINPVSAFGGSVGEYSPEGIAVAADKIYWTDFGKGSVYFADLDGSNASLFADGVTNPRGITASAGRIYWVGQTARKIFSADEDGGNPAEFFDFSVDLPDALSPWDIASDGANLYVSDFATRNLYSIDIATRDVTLILANADAFGIDFSGGVVYFAVDFTNRLRSVESNGENATTLLTAPSGDARWVTVIDPQPLPPVASATANPRRIREDSRKPLRFTIALNKPAVSNLAIFYALRGQARAGRDYTPGRGSGAVAIPAGGTRATVSLRMRNDRRIERNKTIVLGIAKGPGYLPGRAATAIRIDDDKRARGKRG